MPGGAPGPAHTARRHPDPPSGAFLDDGGLEASRNLRGVPREDHSVYVVLLRKDVTGLAEHDAGLHHVQPELLRLRDEGLEGLEDLLRLLELAAPEVHRDLDLAVLAPARRARPGVAERR